MTLFTYRGVDAGGRTRSGRLHAADESSLEQQLHAAGIWLISATRTRMPRIPRRRRRRLPRNELAQFFGLMEFLSRAGVPLVQALDLAAQDAGRREWGALYTDLRLGVESGRTLASAMEQHPEVFPPDITHLIRAGETGGSLPEAFSELRRTLEWRERVASEIRQATAYPATVLGVAACFVLVLFTFVVPKFVVLLAAVKVSLPWPTRVVFGASEWIRFAGIPGILGLVAVGTGFGWLRRRNERLAASCERLLLRLPVWGTLRRLLICGRFARNLALLYRNGVPLLSALQLVQHLLGSREGARSVADARRRIEAGATLGDALAAQPLFPPLLVRLVRIGERTGQLDETLDQVADHYLQQVPRQVRRLLSLLEPALILGLVGVVGFVALAVYLPILSLLQNLR